MFIGGGSFASYRTSWNGGTYWWHFGSTFWWHFLVPLTGGTYWWHLLVALTGGTLVALTLVAQLVALTGVFEARRCEEKQQQTLLHEALYTKNRKKHKSIKTENNKQRKENSKEHTAEHSKQ